jgi:hypothetical protein
MLRKETSISATVAELRNTITIDDTKVSMIAQPATAFKLLRVLNHWIDHLIQYHEDSDTVNIQQEWYIKWKAIYPFIRSSKRKFIDVYRMITDNYTATQDSATVYALIDHFRTTIPVFIECHDIMQIVGKEDDKNYFEFTLKLYFTTYKDDNNKYNEIRSTHSSFVPFTSNNSVTTWKTVNSHSSSETSQVSTSKVPEVVHTDDNVNENENDQIGGISDDSKLSYSPSDKSTNKEIKRIGKNARRTEELKKSVTNICKQEIQTEMGVIREEIGDFTTQMSDKIDNTILSQTNRIVELLDNKKTATPRPDVTFSNQEEVHTIPSLYRQSMPSPKHVPAKSAFNFNTSEMNNEPTTSVNNTKQMHFQRSGTFLFQYQDNTYELRDNDFNKHSANLMTVTNTTDLVQYYKQLQSMAVTYNIFLKPFESLTVWNRSPNTIPTTCMFVTIEVDNNTVDAYRRMKSALYTKLTKTRFVNAEHNAIVQHGGIQQDGFEILYDLMSHCHPKLVSATTKYRKTNQQPTFERSDTIYSYIAKLQVWIDIEKINNHELTDDDILNIVIEQLRGDTRYDLAVAGINSELTLRDTFQRQWGQSVFPDGLRLNNLPGTVMSYYTEDDKKLLFPVSDSTTGSINLLDSTTETAIINSFRGKNAFAREPIDKMCPGCGKYGHSVFHNGCDFCANYLLASEFFKKYPKVSTKVLDTYKDHQLKRQKAIKEKNNSSVKRETVSKRRPYNTRSSKAKVKLLTDMLADVLDIDEQESTSSAEFQDAVDEQSVGSGEKDE